MNPGQLLEQFLGTNPLENRQQTGTAVNRVPGVPGSGSFGGGAVVGGILGLMIGNKKMRKMAGGMLSYGAAAGAGALAYKAFQNWQQGRLVETAPMATAEDLPSVTGNFLPQAAPVAGGQPFQLVLIQAMIGAAKADGHIDAEEQKKLFEQVETLGLDAESKAFVFDALTRPVDIAALAASAQGIEQAAEIYLMSRLAIDPDHPAERAYLDALGHKLNLPGDLMAHLEHQVEAPGA